MPSVLPPTGLAVPTTRTSLAPLPDPDRDTGGGWWPRSRDLTEQLPGLLDALSDTLPDVAVVGYDLAAWKPAPDGLDTATGRVHLQGFVADDPEIVVVIGRDGQTLSLLVVPVGASAATAAGRLEEAGRPPAPFLGSAEERGTDRALASVAARLTRGVGRRRGVAPELIADWVDEAARQFVAAPIQAFVPILVEHLVRSRIVGRPQPA